MRKEQSSNAINEQFLFQVCALNSAISVISGRWKSQLVYSIYQGNNRFHLLSKALPNIAEQVLARQLKELEAQQILLKKIIPGTTPAGIVYELTLKGRELVPLLQGLCNWSNKFAAGAPVPVPAYQAGAGG
ncbi:transcriptional regulator, HxlR family [Chitinophaga costaii]|uniref:Transcriptional regulator, HxlR family n=1 Tax=Chitinophaga costaii TaxID=1335309 RepID=A0A1C3YPC5_9BACT|nr:helix-turn-helix domain-containing protein [Chitinophaga costaii]PUZ30038.1 transcriptional regulator [Chitinophaga costaii]SCB71944.1 transcriptional regulator, HxlR family [Chitinophaga costaii]